MRTSALLQLRLSFQRAAMMAVISFALMLAGIAGYIYAWNNGWRNQAAAVTVSALPFVGAFGVMLAAVWFGVVYRKYDELGGNEPPAGRDDDVLTFSADHHVPGIQIYERVGSGTTLVGYLELDSGTFGDLAETLQANGWCWSRDVLDESGCFSNLRQYQPSGETKYAEVRDEMDRLNVIYKDRGSWWVTPRYQRWFISKSERLSLEHQG